MSLCKDCYYWRVGTRRVFKEGTYDFPVQCDPGKAYCAGPGFLRGQFTPPDFGCLDFTPGEDHWTIEDHSTQHPWEWWEAMPCPDCQGRGSHPNGACHRCAGTAKIRRYGDGFEGEEQYRKHPLEEEFKRKVREVQVAEATLGEELANAKPDRLPF